MATGDGEQMTLAASSEPPLGMVIDESGGNDDLVDPGDILDPSDGEEPSGGRGPSEE
jgi:hypothetical protein